MRFRPHVFSAIFAVASIARADLKPEELEFFEAKIRPILSAECYECHGAKKQKGGLRLDYRDGWKKGGDSGDAIVPGNAAKSLLITSIRHDDPDLKMPDKSPKLDDRVIADFEKWVNMGAPDPRDQPPAELSGKPAWKDLLAARRTWWSLQPVEKPPVPAVQNAAWPASDIDRFLLAKMEAHKLAPAADADAATLLRRLSFTLTGLPPSPQEVEEFTKSAAADRPAAIRAATDRLLASPHFGEHWARHWMDLVRYAETHGSEGDPEIREAWRYRDYLIRAFNSDVPCDQLIREQLAGDLLEKPRINAEGIDESKIGTAQLRLVEHGFQPVDTLDDQVKAVDNQIDVVSKAFQGLTLSCARCHDHKFDAISQRDYYALFGVFASCRPAQITLETPELQAKNRDALERLHGQIKSALADAWQQAATKIGARLLDETKRADESRALSNQIRELEQKVADIEWTARQSLRGTSGANAAVKNTQSPIASWSFEGNARDTFGKLDGTLEGGAEIRNGRLVLDGKSAFLRTAPLQISLTAKTLETWASPANLDQRGGGVLGLESTPEHGFDTIVFAEKEPRRWVAGSEFFKRSSIVQNAADETAKPGELVHLAVTYATDGTITVYRNGKPYGPSYSKPQLRTFEPGGAHVLLGLRHKGAGNGFFAGEIEEARIYDRALTAEEVAASFQAGPAQVVTPQQILSALTPQQREQRAALTVQIEQLRAHVAARPAGSDAWEAALADAATNPKNPLHLWAKLGATDDAKFAAAWKSLADPLRASITADEQSNAANFTTKWNLAGSDYAKWFASGNGLGREPARAGEFAIESEGERVIDGIHPGGALTHRLSEKHNGVLTSPRFKIETESISVRAFGSGGAMARVIVDNYPLPSNPIFPKAVLERDEPGWVRIDTAYRKGSWAYIEFATRDDLTRPLGDGKKKKGAPTTDEPSHFGAEQIVFHDSKEPPREVNSAQLPLLAKSPQSSAELAAIYVRAISEAVAAWQKNQLTEPQRALLDALVRRGLLPSTIAELPSAQPLIAEYHRLEAEVPRLHHAPGVLETLAYDAPFLPRGDHLKPGELVPRSFLEVLGSKPFQTPLSGRRQLAEEIVSAKNPLTARVMANRVWHWVFGRGIVPSVDNFGRLGEKPTHPELLDFLAARFVEEGWSFKQMIRALVTSRAFALSSEPSAAARETDPGNEWLSHARVRRLEAESIRDSLLSVAGSLDEKMFGPPEGFGEPRRSVYLNVRRTSLNPFLQVFDAPKPFTTLGRRDATNVPAQSLTMLNSTFVIDTAQKWARKLVADTSADTSVRVRSMFATAFARTPGDDETSAATAYIAQLAAERQVPADQVLASVPIWQDFAQSLFNLKEFIYLR